jgi:hypothetical protein
MSTCEKLDSEDTVAIPVLDGGTYAPGMVSQLGRLLRAIKSKQVESFLAYNSNLKLVSAYFFEGVRWFEGERRLFNGDPVLVFRFSSVLYKKTPSNDQQIERILSLGRQIEELKQEQNNLTRELEWA